jgi:hypothetical protein
MTEHMEKLIQLPAFYFVLCNPKIQLALPFLPRLSASIFQPHNILPHLTPKFPILPLRHKILACAVHLGPATEKELRSLVTALLRVEIGQITLQELEFPCIGTVKI